MKLFFIKLDISVFMPSFFSALEPEEKAMQDGRIGGETVLVDISSQCGTMNIGIERMEV